MSLITILPQMIDRFHTVLIRTQFKLERLWQVTLISLGLKKPYNIVETELNKYSYADSVEVMLYANMKIIRDFVENEMDVVKWDEDIPHLQSSVDILKCYEWWVFDRPVLSQKFEEETDKVVIDMDRFNGNMNELMEYNRKQFDNMGEFENYIDEKDQEMLHRAIDARFAIWI